MRDILSIFGSGKKAAPPADPAAAPPSSSDAGGLGGISRLLTFGAPKAPPGGASTSSTSAVIDLSGDDGPGPSSAATAAGAGAGAFAAPLPRAPEPQARQQPLQPQQQQQQQPSPAGGALAPAAAKPPRSKREVKHRLMETLRAIKEAEAGGYYDRTAVDKVGAPGSNKRGHVARLHAARIVPKPVADSAPTALLPFVPPHHTSHSCGGARPAWRASMRGSRRRRRGRRLPELQP